MPAISLPCKHLTRTQPIPCARLAQTCPSLKQTHSKPCANLAYSYYEQAFYKFSSMVTAFFPYNMTMKLIISHFSAADFWRRVYPTDRAPANPVSIYNANSFAIKSDDVWQLAPQWVTPSFLKPEAGLLHVLSLANVKSCRTKTHVVHTCLSALPSGSLYELSDDVFICSPEYVFLQLAQSLDLAQLVAYGYELCGTYGFDETAERGIRVRKMPLITKSQLSHYIDSAQGMRGCKRAREALRYIVEGSASPMETVCSILVSFPYRFGGYSLPTLQINTEIDVPPALWVLCPQMHCVADFRIPKKQFVIEYLGEYDHSKNTSMHADRGRTVALREMGFEVLELSATQVWSLAAFEIVAKRISKVSGKRIRSGEFGATKARINLRKFLHSWNSASGRPCKKHSSK